MPDLSGTRAALRADGHTVRAYLAPLLGVVVASGTLTSVPATGATALVWNRTAGSAAAIKPGFRVVVESGAGALKWESSVRYSGTISDTNLPVRELATAEFTLAAADIVKVYNVPILTDKLVEANATFAPDGISYANQNTVIAPIAASGGLWVGFVDSGQTYATITTAGSGSFTVDPDSAGTMAHLWTLPTGVAFAAGSANTDANPTLQADVGYHLVTHAVTDSSNSAVWTQYLPIRVFSAADMPVECVVDALNGDLESGWSGTVRLFDNAALTAIPDRALVAVFVQETVNGAQASYGNRVPSRSHIKLAGYLARDTAEGDAQTDGLTVEIVSPWARLQEIPGFSKVLERYSSTAGWRYVQGLTVKLAILQILRWYTNWTEFWDVGFDTFAALDYPAFNLEKQTPLGQLIELANGVDARVTGDRTGAMRVQTRPELVALASRGDLTTTLTLTDDDRITYRFSREHFRQVEMLECRGFTAATTTAAAVPIFSRYPGTPGRGVLNTAAERLIATSQTDLNARCGLRGAALDGVFITAAGLYHRAVELELVLPGSYDVFDPAYQEWIAFTGAAGNRRGLDLSAYRFVLRSTSVSYTNGTAQTTLRMTSETAAPPGKTYVPPVVAPPPDLPIDFPPIEIPDFNTSPFLPSNSPRIALICRYGLARTTNFGAGAATVWDYQAWTGFSGGAAGIGWTFVPDAFSYASGTVKGWLLTAQDPARVYYVDILNRTWTLKHTFATNWKIYYKTGGLQALGQGGADASFGFPNHFVAAVAIAGSGTPADRGVKAVSTTDNSTFTESYVLQGASTEQGQPSAPPGVWVSSRVAQKARVGAQTYVRGTTDLVNWSNAFAHNGTKAWAASLHSPWDPARNADESIFFYGSGNNNYSDRALRRYMGGSVSVIGPDGFTNQPRNGISTYVGNANRLLWCAAATPGYDGAGSTPYLTDNALAASPTFTALSAPQNYQACAIAGDNGGAFYFWGGNYGDVAAVGFSTNSGATITSQTGNLAGFSPGEVTMLVGW